MAVQKRDNVGVCQGEAVEIHGQRLGLYLVCDSAYSLLPWLIKTFSFSPSLTGQKRSSNTYFLMRVL